MIAVLDDRKRGYIRLDAIVAAFAVPIWQMLSDYSVVPQAWAVEVVTTAGSWRVATPDGGEWRVTEQSEAVHYAAHLVSLSGGAT